MLQLESVESLQARLLAALGADKVHPRRCAALYDLWVEVSEEHYAEFAMSEEYQALYGDMVNRLMVLKKHYHEITDDFLGAMNLPNTREVDTMQQRLQQLRRENIVVEERARRNQVDARPVDGNNSAATKSPPAPIRAKPAASQTAPVAPKKAVKPAAAAHRATRESGSQSQPQIQPLRKKTASEGCREQRSCQKSSRRKRNSAVSKTTHREPDPMSNVPFRSDQVVDEIVQFNQNLSQGRQEPCSTPRKISSGVTPREEVYAEDKLKLYRYQPSTGVVQNRVPTLIVYALVNRPYMTDIQENRSTIRGLLDTGQDVYLIDWGYPDRADKYLTLDDYINGYIDRCVDVIARAPRCRQGQHPRHLPGRRVQPLLQHAAPRQGARTW